VLTSSDELLAVARRLYPQDLPRPFQLLDAAAHVRAGADPRGLAKAIGTTARNLETVALADDPVAAIFGVSLIAEHPEKVLKRHRAIMGQLLLGELAERAFEAIYKRTMGTAELVLEDDRGARTDTDYRVVNGQGRPVFRINIKFHGTAFRKAKDLVGLEPEDCFALATYKIHQGLLKQQNERLPYVFVIVGVPGLTGASVGDEIPADLVQLVAFAHAAPKMTGKRAVEERVVASLIADVAFEERLAGFRRQIAEADWFALSARRADLLLRDRLFDRVYAVRVRAFARNYPNAELDMHFSLREDLTPLQTFLATAKDRGIHGLSVDLERGVL